MRRAFVITTAAGAALLAGVLAGPAVAAVRGATGPAVGPTAPGTSGWNCPMLDGNGPGTGPGNGNGPGTGYGRGMGGGAGRGMGGAGMGMGGMGMGGGAGTGMGMGSRLPAQGTLTAAQKTGLAGMAEEEKLAHDVYVALAGSSGDARFPRIATAESHHLAMVRLLLTRYGVADPTAGRAEGSFASAAVQKQYTDLVGRGDDSATAALGVGRTVEQADLDALAAARRGVTAPDVLAVYDRLAAASQQHLRAFGG